MIEKLYFKTKSSAKIKILLVFNQIPRVPMIKELNDWAEAFKKIEVQQAA
jgi:hypothetical protein